MAEFIIEIPSIDVDDGATVYCPDERHDPMSIEPLVRCRDCKHSHKDGTLCHLFASYAPIAGGDEYEEVSAVVEPDGFCAWAERMES